MQSLIEKVQSLDDTFKEYHYIITDEADQDAVETKQKVLDEHENKVFSCTSRLRLLLDRLEPAAVPTLATDTLQHLRRRLCEVDRELEKIMEDVAGLEAETGMDRCLLRQLEKRIDGLMSELADVSRDILLLDRGSEELLEQGSSIKKALYAMDLKVKRLLYEQTSSPKLSGVRHATTGLKLPKISIRTFDGSIMNWSSFWEQFEVSIHKKENLEDVEKLAYLREALKYGSAKLVIQGLSQMAGNYAEAIKCLQECYNRPQLIHQAHVHAILEAPPLKNGSTKELCRLHDTLNQHLRALKAMKHDCFETFITAAAERNFNQLAVREWQKFSCDCDSVPPYSTFLKFLDLEARGAKITVGDGEGRCPVVTSGKKTITKPSYAVNLDLACMGCDPNLSTRPMFMPFLKPHP